MKAYDERIGTVKPGDTVTDFRGVPATLVSIDRANDYGHDGKVTVERDGGYRQQYYAGVFNLRVLTA